MSFFRLRRNDDSNDVIGVILLVMLLVFVGPNVLPRLLSESFPFVDEGAPCDRLRTPENRGSHQSLIGRAAVDPLELRVQPSTLPTDDTGSFSVRITITNLSIGTVPIVYNPEQVIVGDNGTTGLGITFDPPVNMTTGNQRTNVNRNTFPDDDMRLLGPRQRCVHRVVFPGDQLDPNLSTGQATVRAYYRVTTPGIVPPTPDAPAIFPDMGLNVLSDNVVFSEPQIIPIANLAPE